MIEFNIIKRSKKSWARVGILKTPHGEVETPSLVPVATKAVIKTLTSEEVKQTKTQLTISNTFHLHLKPGDQIVKKAGGINKFMNADWPTMTDSGGFQVFSLGFGHDMQVGKLIKYFPGKAKDMVIDTGSKPKDVR
ncbi:MAG: tRNA-guanine transglycosylase, partial [Candidatus Vogelbacteria bacterium]|nr:tRNA-guanine transglycosylase [Candidatus Vogelbacteria bacterium]